MITLSEIATYLNLSLQSNNVTEFIALTGTDDISLSYENFTAQKVSSIVVTDTIGTTTFAEGDDYTISLSDNTTKITRVSTGDIGDGEIVKVAYAYINYNDYKVIENNISDTYEWLKAYCNNDFLDDGVDNFPDSHKPALAKLIYYFATNNQYNNALQNEVTSESISKLKISYNVSKENVNGFDSKLQSILKEFDTLRRVKFV